MRAYNRIAKRKFSIYCEIEHPGVIVVMDPTLLDAVDVAVERKKLEATLVKFRKDLAEAEKRLSNPSFLERAPAEVVAEEKRRREAARSEIELLERSLADLD